jgi:hypothetical protein
MSVDLERWAYGHRTLLTGLVVFLLTGGAGLFAARALVGREQKKTAAALKQAEANAARAGRAEERAADHRARAMSAELEAKENLEQAEANLARAVKAEGEAKRNLERAEANLALAKKAVDDCFGIARDHPLLQGAMPGDVLHQLKCLLLEKVLPFYQNFRARRPDAPGHLRDETNRLSR